MSGFNYVNKLMCSIVYGVVRPLNSKDLSNLIDQKDFPSRLIALQIEVRYAHIEFYHKKRSKVSLLREVISR